MNRRAVRLAAFSLLLPVPVAMAVPQSATVSTERLVAMSSVPVSGVGDTVLPRVMPLKAAKAAEKDGPSASMTKVSRREQAQAFRASDVAANGVPQAALRAYRTAEATMAIADPSCELSWALLAGIGRVESDHGRYAGSVLGRDGVSDPEILGLPLNGVGPVSAIADTDGGSLDGDKVWDRAVGPMQFIPSTWAMVGVDGDGDGNRNPHDLDDAALAAAAYLCVGGNDLSTTKGMQQAVYGYNHSAEYVTLVLGLAEAYQKGLVDLPALAASPMSGLASGPGVDVGLNEGRGVPIGATDDTSTKEHAKPGTAEDKTKEHGDKPAGNTADQPNPRNNNERNNNERNDQPRGGSDSTPPRGGGDGGNGTGSRNDNGDTGGKGKGGSDDGTGWLDKPKPRPTQPPETEDPTEPPTDEPSEPPTDEPSEPPTDEPSQPPTDEPSKPPTDEPSQPDNSGPSQSKPDNSGPSQSKPERSAPAPTEPAEATGTLVPYEGGGLCVETEDGPVFVTDTMKDKGDSVTISYDPETLELIS